MGLWFTKDPEATRTAEEKMNKLNAQATAFMRQTRPGIEIANPQDTISDPHPSPAAREDERRLTYEDIQKAEKARLVPPPPPAKKQPREL